MRYLKVEVYLPKSHEQEIIDLLNDGGYLTEGPYDRVYASTEVTGHWRPLEGADPFLGAPGEISVAAELKLEFRIKQADGAAVVKLLTEAHPYETPVINCFELWQPD